MEADTDAPNVEAVDDVPAAEEEVITPEQEEALKNVDIDLQERLRKAIRNRLSMIKKKENLDVGDGDDDDKIWQRYETFTQYIKTFGKVLRKHNIPFDDDDHEEQQGPKKVVIDCTAIPALNEWLTEFYNTPPDPARNTVNGVQIVDYSRPEPQDIVKQLTLIEEDAKANEADDVLELLKNHVGDNKEKFALNVFQKLLALNKRQTVGKVKETWQKIAAKHNVTLDITPQDEPPSTSLSRVNEEPANYPEASQEIVAAIERGDIDMDEPNDGDDVEAKVKEDQEEESDGDLENESEKTDHVDMSLESAICNGETADEDIADSSNCEDEDATAGDADVEDEDLGLDIEAIDGPQEESEETGDDKDAPEESSGEAVVGKEAEASIEDANGEQVIAPTSEAATHEEKAPSEHAEPDTTTVDEVTEEAGTSAVGAEELEIEEKAPTPMEEDDVIPMKEQKVIPMQEKALIPMEDEEVIPIEEEEVIPLEKKAKKALILMEVTISTEVETTPIPLEEKEVISIEDAEPAPLEEKAEAEAHEDIAVFHHPEKGEADTVDEAGTSSEGAEQSVPTDNTSDRKRKAVDAIEEDQIFVKRERTADEGGTEQEIEEGEFSSGEEPNKSGSDEEDDDVQEIPQDETSQEARANSKRASSEDIVILDDDDDEDSDIICLS